MASCHIIKHYPKDTEINREIHTNTHMQIDSHIIKYVKLKIMCDTLKEIYTLCSKKKTQKEGESCKYYELLFIRTYMHI